MRFRDLPREELSVLVVCSEQVRTGTETVTESADASHSYAGINGTPVIINRDIPFDNDRMSTAVEYPSLEADVGHGSLGLNWML